MLPLQISSNANAQFKIWKSLLTSKGIKEHQQFFLMGAKLVDEFIKNPPDQFILEYILHDQEILITSSAKKTFLSTELFKELDVLGTKTPLLVISFNKILEKDMLSEPKGLELITPLGDPRNLGALIRTALGFGVNEIILTKDATNPFLPHSVKASAGAVLKMKFSKSAAISELPLTGNNFALEFFGTSINEVVWPKNLRLWVGEEGPGLNLSLEQKRIMKFVTIPTENIESLNAMVSTNLALWEWKKQQ